MFYSPAYLPDINLPWSPQKFGNGITSSFMIYQLSRSRDWTQENGGDKGGHYILCGSQLYSEPQTIYTLRFTVT